MYELFKFIHVLAVIVWIGAGLTFLVLNTRLAASRDEVGIAAMSSQAEWFGKAIFSTAAATTLVAGIVMVLVSDLSFGAFWITWGFTGIALSIVFGAVLSQRAGNALAGVVQTEGAASPKAAALQRKLNLYGVIDLVILVSVVAAMVWKPGT